MQREETLEGRKELRRGCAWYEPSVAETLRSPEIAISFSLSLSLTHFGGCLFGSSLFFRSWTTVMFVNCVFATVGENDVVWYLFLNDNFILIFSMQVLHLIYYLILATIFEIVKHNNDVHWNETSGSVQQYKNNLFLTRRLEFILSIFFFFWCSQK